MNGADVVLANGNPDPSEVKRDKIDSSALLVFMSVMPALKFLLAEPGWVK
jgi:hypothetical protein